MMHGQKNIKLTEEQNNPRNFLRRRNFRWAFKGLKNVPQLDSTEVP